MDRVFMPEGKSFRKKSVQRDSSSYYLITFYQANVWSVHLVATTGHPDKMRPINGQAVSWAKGVPPKPGSVLKNIPWYPPGVLDIDGTDMIAQVVETCKTLMVLTW
jgi:hypothetical protein